MLLLVFQGWIWSALGLRAQECILGRGTSQKKTPELGVPREGGATWALERW